MCWESRWRNKDTDVDAPSHSQGLERAWTGRRALDQEESPRNMSPQFQGWQDEPTIRPQMERER